MHWNYKDLEDVVIFREYSKGFFFEKRVSNESKQNTISALSSPRVTPHSVFHFSGLPLFTIHFLSICMHSSLSSRTISLGARSLNSNQVNKSSLSGGFSKHFLRMLALSLFYSHALAPLVPQHNHFLPQNASFRATDIGMHGISSDEYNFAPENGQSSVQSVGCKL